MRSATTRRRRSPIEAALTGHLVLSTLHTNDAPSAITRLIEMGIEPFLVGSALDCVLAQRLARRLCTKCKEAYDADRRDARSPPGSRGTTDEPLPTLYRAGRLLGLLEDRLQGPARAARGHGRAPRRSSGSPSSAPRPTEIGRARARARA